MASKEPGRGSSNKFIDLSGHQIMNAINSILPINESRTNQVYVYKDHFSTPGYVSKLSEFDKRSQLLVPEVPISDICFDRVIAVMDVIPGNADFQQKIAVKYESDGYVEAVLGLNVNICNNWNIFGGEECRISTSKRKGVDFDMFISKIKGWLAKAEERFQLDMDIISKLAAHRISGIEVHELIGALMTSYHRNQAEPILNLTEVSKLAAECVRSNPETLWDFTNHGTLQIRFDSGDSEFDRIIRFNEFVINYMETTQPKIMLSSQPFTEEAIESERMEIMEANALSISHSL